MYQAIDAPGMKNGDNGYVELWFDTRMAGQFTTGTSGLYTLNLKPTTGSGWYESPSDLTGYVSGEPFSKLFTKGTDYDWAGSFSSSPLSSSPHMQLEFKFKIEILLTGPNKINFNASVITGANPTNSATFSESGYVPMVFEPHVMPEFGLPFLTLAASLAGTIGAVKFRRNLSRRAFLGLPR